jgi:glutaredoxin
VPAPVVALYRRPGCPLCDEAEALLARLAPHLQFTVEAVDIETDDDLLRRYMLEIPVVAVNGVEVARAPLRGDALEAGLRAALG